MWRLPGIVDLQAAINRFLRETNDHPKPFVWTAAPMPSFKMSGAEATRVTARLEDTTTVMLWLANGVSATLYRSLVTAPTCRFAVYGTKGTVELATPDVEFRFTPVTEPPATSRHQAPPHPRSSNTKASIIRAGGRKHFKCDSPEKSRDDLLRVSDIRRMSCPIEGNSLKLAVSKNSRECVLGLLAQSQALS
jgi:GFO/IDH/MocA oxidoreductase family protein